MGTKRRPTAETLARALFDAAAGPGVDHGREGWASIGKTARAFYRRLARRAIAELVGRTP